jgi:hypothetical protein
MSISLGESSYGSLRTVGSRWQRGSAGSWWSQHGEASLNWLALGLLLAAWNASNNDLPADGRRRPESLRGYAHVSVRAATLHSVELRASRRFTSQSHKSVNVL